jgi:hypothetical protein
MRSNLGRAIQTTKKTPSPHIPIDVSRETTFEGSRGKHPSVLPCFFRTRCQSSPAGRNLSHQSSPLYGRRLKRQMLEAPEARSARGNEARAGDTRRETSGGRHQGPGGQQEPPVLLVLCVRSLSSKQHSQCKGSEGEEEQSPTLHAVSLEGVCPVFRLCRRQTQVLSKTACASFHEKSSQSPSSRFLHGCCMGVFFGALGAISVLRVTS